MTDAVRTTYRPLSPPELAKVQAVKQAGQALMDAMVDAYGPNRGVDPYAITPRTAALNQALTRVQEAVMWATYGLTG